MGKILKTLHSGAINPILPFCLEKKDFGRIRRQNSRENRQCTLIIGVLLLDYTITKG